MTEADSSESAGSEKLEDDYEFLDYNNGGVFVQVRFLSGLKRNILSGLQFFF